MNYYELMGVEPTANLEQIREKYKQLVMKIHPDRVLYNKDTSSSTTSTSTADQTSSSGGGGSSSSTSPSDANNSKTANIEFYQVQDAWKTLSNPSRRFLYDMRTFGSSTEFPECDETYLLELEKAQAERDVINMSSYLQKVTRREAKARGVIILDSWYGDMAILQHFYNSYAGGLSPCHGQDSLYADVKVATQCQVDYKAHRLIISGGSSTSRSDLPGFYNPIPLSLRSQVELGLFIRYQFGDEMHEVLANDTEPIYIPKRSHALSAIREKMLQDQAEEEALKWQVGLHRMEYRYKFIVLDFFAHAFENTKSWFHESTPVRFMKERYMAIVSSEMRNPNEAFSPVDGGGRKDGLGRVGAKRSTSNMADTALTVLFALAFAGIVGYQVVPHKNLPAFLRTWSQK